MTPRQLRRRLLLSLALGLAVLVGLLLYGDLSGVASSLADFRWVYLPAILGLTLFNYAVRFLKWEYYLRLAGIRDVPRWDSFLIFFAGLAMTVTPAKVGEWLKSYFLKESHQVPVSRSAPIVVAERFTDGYGMILLAVAGLFLFKQGWVFILAVTVIGLGAIGAFRFRPFAGWSIGVAGRIPLLRRHTGFLAGFYESAFVLFAPKPLAIGVGLGFISWLGEGIAMYYVLLGLGAPNGWELVVQGVFILAVTSLAGAVFLLPGGLGVAEGGIAGLSQTMVGLSRQGAATGTLIIRLCTLWFGVAIGLAALLVLMQRLRRRKATEKLAGEAG